MVLESWWFIVAPIFFGLGWLAARLDGQQLLKENSSLPKSYFRGLNLLLNEQPDQAIDAFIEVAKLDPEMIELHFALGNLFRRRGETGRAIRVHQNLVNRPGLSPKERAHVLFELGQDFLKAGILDRAEDLLRSLIDGEFATQARLSLLYLYELEKDWHRAIVAAEQLQHDKHGDYSRRIAYFYCELAHEALKAGQLDSVEKNLDFALKNYPQCPRAILLRGSLHARSGNDQAALATWHQTPSCYQPLIVAEILAAYRRLGCIEEALVWLNEQMNNVYAPDLLEAAHKEIVLFVGIEEAERLSKRVFLNYPSLSVLEKLYEARQTKAEAEHQNDEECAAAYRLLMQHNKQKPRYQCRNCGFQARLFHWQCPGCAQWETFPLARIEK